MRNINIIGLAVFAFAALTTGIVAANPAVSAARPNIIFILGDDLGKEWISCYGAEDVRTPNIDALAAGGMKFNNFYAMPKCTPTRVG
jgi:arylsulfatase A-like enzyme